MGWPIKPPTANARPSMVSVASGRTLRSSLCPVIRLSSATVAAFGASRMVRLIKPLVSVSSFWFSITHAAWPLPASNQSSRTLDAALDAGAEDWARAE